MAGKLTPTPKVAAGTVAGALGVALVYVAGLFDLELPEEVAGALVLLMTAAAAYLTRDRTSPPAV